MITARVLWPALRHDQPSVPTACRHEVELHRLFPVVLIHEDADLLPSRLSVSVLGPLPKQIVYLHCSPFLYRQMNQTACAIPTPSSAPAIASRGVWPRTSRSGSFRSGWPNWSVPVRMLIDRAWRPEWNRTLIAS